MGDASADNFEGASPDTRAVKRSRASPGNLSQGAQPCVRDCLICEESSATTAWNRVQIAADGTRSADGDVCRRCATGYKIGQFDGPFSKVLQDVKKEKLDNAPAPSKLALDIKSAGDIAIERGISINPPLLPENAFEDFGNHLWLKTYGQLLSPQDFQTQHGVSAQQAGLSISTLPSQFGPKSGILVEDTSKPPTVIFLTSW